MSREKRGKKAHFGSNSFRHGKNEKLKITEGQSDGAFPAGYDMSRSLPGKAVVNLSDHFGVAKSQTFHLKRESGD